MSIEENKRSDEAEIRALIDDAIAALRAKDLDRIMKAYAPELVAFDIVPPLQYVGADAYRRRWQESFALFQGSVAYDVHDLDITTGDDVAFSHSLNHLSGTMPNGQKLDVWVRWTACYRKIEGKWLITHTQVSVPVDLAQGAAVLSLKPAKPATA